MPEKGSSGIKAKFHTWLRKLKQLGAPLWFLKTYGNQFQRAGVPDYIICVAGQMLAIELKAPEDAPEPEPIQAIELRDLKRAGAFVLCTNDLDVAKALVLQELRRAEWQMVQ